jgi:hypothetical protein
MTLTTMWTHGNSLVVEDPGEYEYIRHRAYGTLLKYNAGTSSLDDLRVCHIPIPTPQTVDGASPVIAKIIVLFQTDANAAFVAPSQGIEGVVRVEKVDVWDGPTLVTTVRLNDWHGSHLSPDGVNQLAVPPTQVHTGIGVSLFCSVDGDFDPSEWFLIVGGVAADFVYPNPPLVGRQLETERVRGR